MLIEINNFFREHKAQFGNYSNFKESALYEFYGNIFGPLVYTENTDLNFIGLDQDGFIYDEIYYPQCDINRIGTIIPQIFLERNITPAKPHPLWKEVSQLGFSVISNIKVDQNLADQALHEAFIPHGINPQLNMSKSIYHAYFATLADYKKPEWHKTPEYMNQITAQCLAQIPAGPPIMQSQLFTTADIVKYIYEPSDSASIQGPYSFHMDYFPRLLYMFFLYFSQSSPILGRELLVGKRDDFLNFDQEALDMSPAVQPQYAGPFEKVTDDKVKSPKIIKIEHGTVVIMNTLNPLFVHRVEKLKHKNEVVLMTNYLWSSDWPKLN